MSTHTAIVAKARLRNFGNGVLEVGDDIVRFYVETGRFKKQRKIVREIPMAEIEGVERLGDDLSLTWKGAAEIFAIEQKPQVDTIYEKVNAILAERMKAAEQQRTADQKRNELAQTTLDAIATADSLFTILRALHGRIDWKFVETSYKQCEENVTKLVSQDANRISLDIKPLSAAVQSHHPNEIAEKTCDVLEALYEHFDVSASTAADSQQPHPNQHEAKLMVHAFYLLNDIALGAIVGDPELGKEGMELLKTLENLAKSPDSRIDVNAAKASLDKFMAGKGKQSAVLKEIESMIERQLKELAAPVTAS